ncbi:hypothetical protein HQ560_04825, partial [bacterium]|nr:hypothetical protein [bacterium]
MRMSLASLLVFLSAAHAWSVPVEKWVQTTGADFQAGKAEGVAILPLGKVVLAPELQPLLKESVPHVMALAADTQGTLYAATGMEARLLRIRAGKVDTFFKAVNKTDLEFLAVTVAPDGHILASAAPSGTLFRISPKGEAKALYRSPDPYIWSIAVAADGSVIAGTGPNGKLVKITADGKATTLLKANASHILCVLRADDGTIYAGTDRNGLLYAVSPKGEARVVYDAAESDIRALAIDPKGRVYFATAAMTTSAPKPAIKTTSRGVTVSRGATTSRTTTAKPSAPGSKLSATNAIYRLEANGDVTRLTTLSGAAVYALAWHRDHLYAGTGNDGKLYRLDEKKPVQLVDLKDQAQILALAVSGKTLHLATANAGQVYRVAADHRPKATFVSDVYDTGSIAQWGRVSWQESTPGDSAITLGTRTGNTKTPDASWSAWSEEGDRAAGQHVASPAARFIQYRATLTTGIRTSSPVLDEVVVAYLSANRPPKFLAVKVGKPPKPRTTTSRPMPGQSVPKPAQPSVSMNSKKQPNGSQRGPYADRVRAMWKATDPNKDSMIYSLAFRGADETTWKLIRDELIGTYLDWDTHAVPDGAYRLRITASDARTNPPERALETKYTTQTFLIDNTPPVVSNLAVRVGEKRALTVSAQLAAAGSGVASADYAVDG